MNLNIYKGIKFSDNMQKFKNFDKFHNHPCQINKKTYCLLCIKSKEDSTTKLSRN